MQKDLAVLGHGIIWTGVTQFKLCHDLNHAWCVIQYVQVTIGGSFWLVNMILLSVVLKLVTGSGMPFLPLASTAAS